MLRRLFLYSSGFSVGSYFALTYPELENTPEWCWNARVLAEGVVRAGRCAWLGAYAAYEYNVRTPFLSEGGSASQKEWNESHRRVAEAMVDTAQRCGGLYIKTAQGFAAGSDVLPPIYTTILRKLQNEVEPRPVAQVLKLLQHEWKTERPLDRLAAFDEKPIACASIAQVHVGVLHDGRRVAVKAQKLEIASSYQGDLELIMKCFSIAGFLWPSFDWSPFFRSCEQTLHKELLFSCEIEHSQRIGADLKKRYKNDEIIVPEVVHELSTDRVLVTEFVENSCHAKDSRAQMLALGVDPAAAARLLSDVFAYQMFVAGFAACDCHGGNILLRRHPRRKNETQVVLIDHGLSYEIPDRERHLLADLWTACATRDDAGIIDVMKALNMTEPQDNFQILACVFLQTLYSSFSIDKKAISQEDLNQVRAGMFDDRVTKIIGELPTSFLLALSTISQHRAVHKLLMTGEPNYVSRPERFLRVSLQSGRKSAEMQVRNPLLWAVHVQISVWKMWFYDFVNSWVIFFALIMDPSLKQQIPDELLQLA